MLSNQPDYPRILPESLPAAVSLQAATKVRRRRPAARESAAPPEVPDERRRLLSALRAVAEGLQADRAALYLLDDATTELQLEAGWCLPQLELLVSTRPLASAVADLEALVGHAVALEDGILNELWQVPEPCGASICVPVAGPAIILGTLWLYFPESRQIFDRDTNLAELAAGYLAAELERRPPPQPR